MELTFSEWFHDFQSCETVKHGHGYHGTWNQEQPCWQGPAAIYMTDQLTFNQELDLAVKESVLSRIVVSCYLTITSEQTEHFMCAVVVVIYSVCKSVRQL
jgi:hypothetical protein